MTVKLGGSWRWCNENWTDSGHCNPRSHGSHDERAPRCEVLEPVLSLVVVVNTW